ncbi:protein 4.1 homolog [Trichonephila clavipes]|nr:protein 4.1 homolog [Trichonephila clavipes]
MSSSTFTWHVSLTKVFLQSAAECGDFVSEDYPDHTYVSSFKFVPHQDAEFEHKIMENHKKHIGQSPAEADLNLLETARRCELYGIKMTPAKNYHTHLEEEYANYRKPPDVMDSTSQ